MKLVQDDKEDVTAEVVQAGTVGLDQPEVAVVRVGTAEVLIEVCMDQPDQQAAVVAWVVAVVQQAAAHQLVAERLFDQRVVLG